MLFKNVRSVFPSSPGCEGLCVYSTQAIDVRSTGYLFYQKYIAIHLYPEFATRNGHVAQSFQGIYRT